MGHAASSGGVPGEHWRMMLLKDVLRQWAERLRAVGSEEPQTEARLIACHLLGLEPGLLATRLGMAVEPDLAARGEMILAGRAERRPLAYLLGETWFYGLRFRCDERALVPRPETELLVDAALEWLQGRDEGTVADIGTGTGCLACTLAANNPSAWIIATDLSWEALSLARENAEALGVADRVRFLQGDLMEPLFAADLTGSVEALVANLPYVAESEYLAGQPELWHEPRAALVPGPTGLEALENLVFRLPELPRARFVALEIGATQAEAITNILCEVLPSWQVCTRRDYAGLDRIVVATRPEPEVECP